MEVLRNALLIGASDVATTHEDSLANRGVEPKRLTPVSPNADVVCCVKTSLPQIGIVLGAELSLFPHDILRLLVISQSNEFRMPEMAHIGPLHKLKLPYKLRL